MILSTYNLGRTQVVMEQYQIHGVPVVRETLRPPHEPERVHIYVDPLFVYRQEEPVRRELKLRFTELDQVEFAIKRQLQNLR